ncbi:MULTISPECIES: Asp23/Gls24 family envelope stress response protein [Enterococcus]|jgi:uncharacterized alkaline shock family protein YloU|uniref:Asp23/Gls24 family envelope stress response protein n=1 Tax=Enterococcus TaxID=1350 RepID=UPI000A34F0B0|nr:MULTISPECIES: Asp23/Gls24 family envelope stress response protein [Enterococcus]AXG40131.1 Asp23/Gls24 family envelope stress response protein [Enterococcus gilvus]OTO72937.1 hypothetical protein A5865_001892 [Enterococcus sp. 12E11_DIV0728]OUZ14393.1 hypothetical protein A5868_003416 [Enterococcus sp. 12F9_DIV0723]
MVENFEKKNLNEKAGASTPTHSNPTHNNHESDEVKGEVSYDDKVIQKIIGVAIEQIDGLLTVDGGFFSNVAGKLVNTDNVTAGIETEVGKKQVAVDMDVVVEYGKDITEVANKIKRVVRDEVGKMTHLDVIEVNIHVVDIKTKEEFEQDSETVQDKVTSAAKTTGEFASEQTEKAKDAAGRGTDKAKEKIDENREPRVE